MKIVCYPVILYSGSAVHALPYQRDVFILCLRHGKGDILLAVDVHNGSVLCAVNDTN